MTDTRETLSRLLNERINSLSTHERLRLLHYMIWIHGEERSHRDLWIRRPGNTPCCLGDQLELEQLQTMYLVRHNRLKNEDKKHLESLLNQKTRPKLNDSFTHALDRGIRILDQHIDSLRFAKQEFLKETKDMDVLADDFHCEDIQNEFNLGQFGSSVATHDTLTMLPQKKSTQLTIILQPLSLYRKLKYNHHLYEKRFYIVADASQIVAPLGSLGQPLANELLLLISDRFNRLHNCLAEYAKVQLLLLVLVHFLFHLPYTFQHHILRYFLLFLQVVYCCFLYTKMFQTLWKVCKEVNAVTGRLGVYFGVTSVNLTVALRISFDNPQKTLMLYDFILSQGGSRFLHDFDTWSRTQSQQYNFEML